MKTILKVLSALAVVAGAVYAIATYGDQIVAFAKKLMAACPCKCGAKEAECECAEECACEEACECTEDEEAPAEEACCCEEAPAEEACCCEEEKPCCEEVPAEPVADEADFEK